jgi:hypothetical protein
MLKKYELLNKAIENEDVDIMFDEACIIYKNLISEELSNLHLEEYTYDTTEAVEELGLDETLIEELVEDYVSQVIKSLVQFELHLEELQDLKENKQVLNYVPFRELAHKNLGVARNLRIKDSEVLLYALMTQTDLEYLILCMEALKASVIKLNAKCAYNTLKLIKVKSSL